MHQSFPADIFTACITDPLRIYIKWLLLLRKIEPVDLSQEIQLDDVAEKIDEDFAYRLSGTFVLI